MGDSNEGETVQDAEQQAGLSSESGDGDANTSQDITGEPSQDSDRSISTTMEIAQEKTPSTQKSAL